MPPGQGDQCIFCQLIDNPEQLLAVGETDSFYAWLDIHPRAKGHTMVVPKKHIENVMEFDPGMWDEGMRLAREVVEKAKKGLGAEGASITINIDEAGGQMMPHAYIQVFPRFTEDENAGTPTGAIFPQRDDLQDDLQDFQEKMADAPVDFEETTKEAHPDSKNHIDSSTEPEPSSEKVEPEEVERERPSRGESIEWI